MKSFEEVAFAEVLAASDVIDKISEVGEGVEVQLGPLVEGAVVPDRTKLSIGFLNKM